MVLAAAGMLSGCGGGGRYGVLKNAVPDNSKEGKVLNFCVYQEGTKQICGVSNEVAPGLFAYRRSIAKDVLGTDDPNKVQAARLAVSVDCQGSFAVCHLCFSDGSGLQRCGFQMKGIDRYRNKRIT